MTALSVSAAKESRELLNAVIANPKDDTLRLIYADWFEENGDTDRAAYIRLEIAYEGVERRILALGKCNCFGTDPTGCSRCREGKRLGYWKRREEFRVMRKKALDKIAPRLFNDAWCERAEPETNGVWFTLPDQDSESIAVLERGFVSLFSVRHDSWLKWGPYLVSNHPVERVILLDREPRVFQDGRHVWVRQRENDKRRELTGLPNRCLAPELFDLLPGETRDEIRYIDSAGWNRPAKEYPRGVSADDMISEACLTYARKKARELERLAEEERKRQDELDAGISVTMWEETE